MLNQRCLGASDTKPILAKGVWTEVKARELFGNLHLADNLTSLGDD